LIYFTNTNLLGDNQYEFRPHQSREYATLEMVDRITTQTDQNQIPIGIYFFLSKTFDTLDYASLLENLNQIFHP